MGAASRIVLILLALLYIIIPYDAISDLRLGIGWLDDLAVLGLLVFYLRRGRAGIRRNARAGYGRTRIVDTPEEPTREMKS